MQSTAAANRSLETESAETLAAAGEEEKTSAGLVVENTRVWRPVDLWRRRRFPRRRRRGG
jgi:hypothetical protein